MDEPKDEERENFQDERAWYSPVKERPYLVLSFTKCTASAGLGYSRALERGVGKGGVTASSEGIHITKNTNHFVQSSLSAARRQHVSGKDGA